MTWSGSTSASTCEACKFAKRLFICPLLFCLAYMIYTFTKNLTGDRERARNKQ